MSNYLLIFIIICYLAFLFFLAYRAEKNQRKKWVNNPYIYVLSLAVYCTAWTFYGSVGIAAKSGISFLTIYLGPVIAMPLWLVIMQKIIKISKQHKISSIADFISLRYGNNRFLGALVTVTCLLAIIPYIALQLKAVSETFSIMSSKQYIATGILDDSTLYIALIIAIFVVFFGTQLTDASKGKRGIMVTVAVESILKLVFFLVIGFYVVFYLFDGTEDIYNQASLLDGFEQLNSFGGLNNGFNWMFTICLSFFAIFLLPRQFHVAVIENQNIKDLKKAIWMFPLYLLLFNVFVIFIAWAGNLKLPASMNSDYYSLLLPLNTENTFLALLVFMGGFSAVISMIVVSTLALSTMVSNSIIIPYGFLKKLVESNSEENAKNIKNIRRLSIFIIIIFAYLFYIQFSKQLSLFSIGLISFVIIAQLAPSFFLGLFWRRGSSKAANVGIILGLVVVMYTLLIPIVDHSLGLNFNFIQNGLFNIEFLKPSQLLGIKFLTPESNAFLWSMSLNTSVFIVGSLLIKGNYRERNYAEMFVNNENYENLQDEAFIWKGEAYVSDIRRLLVRFLGDMRTQRALSIFNKKYGISENEQKADSRLINFSEKLLTGSLGSVSAKILLTHVTKEKPISLVQVLEILEESKETKANNKLLLEKSDELSAMTHQLQEVNKELREQDKMKDDFLDTVAHELKTPITSIKAASEILSDDDMPSELRQKFLDNIIQDTDRLATLIHNILDLEKLSSNRTDLDIAERNINLTIQKSIDSIQHLADKKHVNIHFNEIHDGYAFYDEDRILQVLVNLLSNSLKFVESTIGTIKVLLENTEKLMHIIVEDNGRGIPKEDNQYIFDKFYQSKNQNIQKPQGSGFGLAICKQIIESHQGEIWVDQSVKEGARLVFTLQKKIWK